MATFRLYFTIRPDYETSEIDLLCRDSCLPQARLQRREMDEYVNDVFGLSRCKASDGVGVRLGISRVRWVLTSIRCRCSSSSWSFHPYSCQLGVRYYDSSMLKLFTQVCGGM